MRIIAILLRKWVDIRITNISQSLPHKMAENSWYEEITSLSPYMLWEVCLSVHEDISGTTHAIFTNFLCLLPVCVARSSSGMLTIGRIAYWQEGGDGSTQRGHSVIYDCLVEIVIDGSGRWLVCRCTRRSSLWTEWPPRCFLDARRLHSTNMGFLWRVWQRSEDQAFRWDQRLITVCILYCCFEHWLLRALK